MATTDVLRRRTGRSPSSLADLGILTLRIAVAATALHAGITKALNFTSTAQFMADDGWRPPTFAAYLVTATEIAGGLALLLGLLTPLAACGIIAAMIDAWAATASGAVVWSDPFNVPFLMAFAATALLFVGAGAHSVDARIFGRPSWPGAVTIPFFLVAVVAAVATWVLLNGVNPLHLSTPTG
ncbi:DoxX family protein [Mycobacterium yunnanensis]|uniref:DoxX family protein n=1 Tax=Mycobacterium yunnanensis TaxID=368477 RepID=A0A9X2YY76_9MYCO|nr:DoxX family protein [Mycobacterium yunnanensis]MCV7419726.1 DoxX family protein [Mycobacterium yunnanensis]